MPLLPYLPQVFLVLKPQAQQSAPCGIPPSWKLSLPEPLLYLQFFLIYAVEARKTLCSTGVTPMRCSPGPDLDHVLFIHIVLAPLPLSEILQ